MKLTKSGLKEMIRECLQEELAKDSLTEGGAMSGGYAEHGAIDNHARPGASTQPSKKNYLDRLKSKNSELVDVITVKGKDIKPGMITQAGQAREVKVEYSNHYKKDMVYIMHTNDYDGFWDVDEDMEVMADPDDKSKPFTGDYKELLKRGLKESAAEDIDTDDVINEAATGFRLSSSALLSIEDLADAVYRDTDPDAIKKYASDKAIQDVTAEDLAIAADNSDYPREVKYLAAHMKNKGVATIGEFAATLTEALSEDVDTMDWDTLIKKADELLDELIKVSGNEDYDDGDGYWSGEEGHIWANRYLYYTDKLNDSARLESLCDEYSRKLPNVDFYYIEDDFLDDPSSEIGYEATNVNW